MPNKFISNVKGYEGLRRRNLKDKAEVQLRFKRGDDYIILNKNA
jgi:hypothetical protein